MECVTVMNNRHFVSIIIPALNAGGHIRECLDSLAKLNYPRDNMEIIVVDSGSQDNTMKIVEEFNVNIVKKKNTTISASRNLGASYAKGNILAFIDADCIAPSDWLKNAVGIFNAENVAAVGAEYRLSDNSSWIEKAWYLQIETRRKNGSVEWLPSCNIIVLKEHFIRVGGFKEDLITSEDVDFCRRLRAEGLKILASNQLSVVHLENPKTLRKFFLKEFWRGKGPLQNFLTALPKIRLTKAISFALYTLLCSLAATIGLLNGVIYQEWVLFSISGIAIILPVLTLSAKVLFRRQLWQYFLPLAFLYLLYGIARALCILDYRNWRFSKATAIPILLYHDIRDDNFDLSAVEPRFRPYILKESDFISQIEWLRDRGYNAVGLQELANQLDDQTVCIVFDDGWVSNYQVAHSILCLNGIKASFFVTVENVGKPDMMDWDEIKELQQNGMTIGSHSMTHRIPAELSDDKLNYELSESKRILEEHLNQKIEFFSSPTGFSDFRLERFAQRNGYKAACLSKVGFNYLQPKENGFLRLNKIGIKRGYSLDMFKDIVRGKRSTLVSLRSKQLIRNYAKSFLGPRRYEGLKKRLLPYFAKAS